VLTATAASSSAGTGTTSAPADSSSLLFSAQFFTVNATLFLLIASSLPIATWMLGLSSFDLETFYPPAAAQLLLPPSGPSLATSQRSSSSNSGGSLLLHLYNLTFLALTFWHATQISSAIVLWVLVDQLLARLERAVHRARVALGWARADQPAFMLFRSWRTSAVDGAANAPPRTRAQKVLRVLSALWHAAHWMMSPFARALWFVLVRLWRVSCLLFWHAWDALTVFLMQELSDDLPPSMVASTTATAAVSKQKLQLPSASPVSPGSPDEATAQSPSVSATHAVSDSSTEAAPSVAASSVESGSLTSQLLAEVDAASQQVAAAATAAASLFAGTEMTLALPTAPGPESPSSRRALSSIKMSPLLSEEEQQRVDLDAETAAATGLFARSLSAPPHLHVNATAATDDASVNAAVAADVAASMDASVAAAVSLEATVTPLHSAQPHHLPQRSLDFSPLFRSQTAARSLALGTHSLLATPVPGLSRLLSGDVRSSPSVVSGAGVSELDFPVISTGAADSPIDEEEDDDDASVASSAMSSAASSAVGTPQRSPLYSPMQLTTPFAQHAAARGGSRHRLHRSFDVPPLELSASLFDATSTGSASASVNGDNGSDYSVSPWTPSSSGSARSASASSVRDATGDASRASPAHATTIASSASSVRERLALAASAGGGGGGGGAVWLRRLEPMAEEEEERVADGDVDGSDGRPAVSSSPAFVAASSALVDAPSSLHSSRSQSASSASSSESTGSNGSAAATDAADVLSPQQSTPPLRTRTRTRSSSNSNSPQPRRSAGEREDEDDPRVKLSGSHSTSESASDAEEGEA
jgi:hypothetical protein